MQALIAAKADVDKANKNGFTRFQIANHNNNSSIVTYLKSVEQTKISEVVTKATIQHYNILQLTLTLYFV